MQNFIKAYKEYKNFVHTEGSKRKLVYTEKHGFWVSAFYSNIHLEKIGASIII